MSGPSARRNWPLLLGRGAALLVAVAIWLYGLLRFADGDGGVLGFAAIALASLIGVLAAGGRPAVWFEGFLNQGPPMSGSVAGDETGGTGPPSDGLPRSREGSSGDDRQPHRD